VRRGAIAAVLLSVAAYGQIGVPTLGYLPEGPRIRVMQGIPGAGVVGPILGVGRNLAQITISPRQDYILASDAQTGQVLQIVPGAASASITAIPGASANPDQIVMSPSGSSAVLWFLATNRAEIISGLPASASIRGIDASVLGAAPGAMAISDDGAWLAASTLAATGIYIFAGDSSMSAIPLNDFANGLAFFHNQATLAITTSTGVSTVGLPGAALQTIYASARTLPPAGLAVSFDNQRIAIAEYSGTLTSVDLAGNVSSALDCTCAPAAMYGIGGSIFRITGPMLGAVRLFDAANNRILEVPNALSAALPEHSPSTRRLDPAASLPALPAVTIGGLPASSGPDQQPAMTISIASAYPVDITGTATLAFASSVGGDDQTIQFGTGGRTVSFTIPAGSTQASFSGKSSVVVMTGTVAGAITITLDLMASGTDVTPTPPPTATITLTTTPPFIQLVQFGSATTNGFTVVVTGFSSTRDMVSGSFQFAPSTNATLATTTVTVPLSPAFMTWYSNSASNAFGSQFQLTVPFTTQNGPSLDVVAVTVALTNSKGASNPVVNQ
jgi:hypothetical protein